MHMLKKSFFVVLAALLVLITSCSPVIKYINSDDVLHWEAQMQVFDSLNAVEPADANTLLVTGSSSVRLWDSIHSDLAPYRVMQRGYGGAKLSDFNHYAERIIKPQQFKAILIFVANDIAGGDNDRTPREVFQLYKTLVKKIRERNPDTPLFWIEVTPTPSRWHAIEQITEASDMIRKYCDRNEDLFFIETYDVYVNQDGLPDPDHFRKDMLHLNRGGYKLWAQRILFTLDKEGIKP